MQHALSINYHLSTTIRSTVFPQVLYFFGCLKVLSIEKDLAESASTSLKREEQRIPANFRPTHVL